MENFVYRKISIFVNDEDLFTFKFNYKNYKFESLKKAKEKIDELTNTYYTFTQLDMDKLMSKLNEREQSLVRSLYEEIDIHRDNNYCELGICNTEWRWEWDFSK